MFVFMVLSLVGFVASLCVHLSSWGHQPLGIEQTWPLHVGIFLVFIPMVVGQKREQRDAGRTSWRARRERQERRYPLAPWWMRKLLELCGLYAIVNFLVFFVLMLAFTPNVREHDGHYVIEKNRHVVRPATDEEVRTYRSRIARGFSGHWMVFYWASFVGLIDSRRRHAIEAADREARLRSPTWSTEGELIRHYAGVPPLLLLSGHVALMMIVGTILAFGLPLAEFIGIEVFQRNYLPHLKILGLVAVLSIPPVGWFGLSLGPRLLRRIPARCPICDGRAYYIGGTIGSSSQPREYRCADCGVVVDQAETG